VRVIFTPLAERQIDELHGYISATANEDRADRYIGRIVEACKALNDFPLRGSQRDDILAGLRIIGFERRVTIAFMIAGDDVLIEGIFYGGQNVAALLSGEP
jgi:toxin ParE1/3/4